MSPVTPQPRDLELLRAMPLAGLEPDTGARARARARLLDAASLAAPQHQPVARPARPRSRPAMLRRRLITAALALSVATAAVAAGLGGGSDEPVPGVTYGGGIVRALVGVPTASADDALRAAAAAAVGQPTVPFTKDTRWVVRSQRAELLLNNGTTAISNGKPVVPLPKAYYAFVRMTRITETTSFDGNVVASSAPLGLPRFTTRAALENYRDVVGTPKLGKGSTYPIIHPGHGSPKPFEAGRKQLSYDDLQAVPTDTPSLARWVLQASSFRDNLGKRWGTDDWSQLQTITGLMTRAPLSPALRAGLWRVAARFSSLRSLGPTRDPAGRMGMGLSIAHPGEREEIVFSPQTGMLLSAWIYKDAPITTCDQDLRYCSPAEQRAGDQQGKPWTPLTLPGTVESGTTVLSAVVEPK